MINTIIHGDCLEIMPLIPAGSVDMIFCDLPYGTTRSPWDIIIPFEPLWEQYKRIIKENGAIALFAAAPFDKLLACSNMKMYKYDWIWEKNKAPNPFIAKIMPMQNHESILIFYKRPPTYNPQMETGHKPINYAVSKSKKSSCYGDSNDHVSRVGETDRYPNSVLSFPVVNNDDPERTHPNQKPVELCEYLVKTYTNEGQTVLDNCTGSASIPMACMNTGRNFIAIEKDIKIWNDANYRINNRQLVINF